MKLKRLCTVILTWMTVMACRQGPSDGPSPAGPTNSVSPNNTAVDAKSPAAVLGSGPSASASDTFQQPAHDTPTNVEACQDWSSLAVESLPPLPTGSHVSTFEQVWNRVREKYYDPTVGCLDWPALRVQYGAKVAQAKDATQAFAAMNEMLSELDQSHFGVIAPAASQPVPKHVEGPARPDFEVRWLGGAAIVVRSGVTTVPPGARVFRVDGAAVDDIIVGIRPHDDRPESRNYERAQAIMKRLSCPEGDAKNLTIAKVPGASQQRLTITCTLPVGERMSLGNLRDVPTTIEAKMIDGSRVGWIRFNIWMLPMVAEIAKGVANLRAQGATALVVDLRGNPGGVGAMAVAVARYLTKESLSLGRLQFRDFAQTFNVHPDPGAFGGPLAILVDERTASTSEIFALGMKDAQRAIIVGGSASAGAALPSILEQLPDGALLQYVVGDYRSSQGRTIEGRGVAPDHTVRETRADYIAGRDPVLRAAVEQLMKGG